MVHARVAAYGGAVDRRPDAATTPAAARNTEHCITTAAQDELVLCLSGAGVSAFDVPAIIAVMHSGCAEWRRWADMRTTEPVASLGRCGIESSGEKMHRGVCQQGDVPSHASCLCSASDFAFLGSNNILSHGLQCTIG